MLGGVLVVLVVVLVVVGGVVVVVVVDVAPSGTLKEEVLDLMIYDRSSSSCKSFIVNQSFTFHLRVLRSLSAVKF